MRFHLLAQVERRRRDARAATILTELISRLREFAQNVPREKLTIYITVFVTRGRHFGARESVLLIFFRGKAEKKY
jgi:hypothetical protein